MCEGLQYWIDLVSLKSREQKSSVFVVCDKEGDEAQL